jgi:hypothetical protein
MFDAARLSKMKDGALLINMGVGPLLSLTHLLPNCKLSDSLPHSMSLIQNLCQQDIHCGMRQT